MLHRLFKRLMPKADGFTVLFTEQSACLVEATTALQRRASPGGDDNAASALLDAEHKADAVAERIYRLLNRSFVTPFRRGEMRDLVGALDDVADYAADVAKRAEIYRVGDFMPEMAEMAQCAAQCAVLIAEAMPLTQSVSRNAETINGLCERIHLIEDQADRAYDRGLTRLYGPPSADGKDGGVFLGRTMEPVSLVAMERLFDLVEEVVDACDDVAKLLGNIVAENA